MGNFVCPDGCCTLKIKPYNLSKNSHVRYRKAGIFIYDPKKDKVLLIQSRGHLWGSPKGTIQYGETERQCAIREVKEETGLEISDTEFLKAVNINNNVIYFYIERDECNVEVQEHVKDNDANGIGWIKPDCIEKCIKNGHITLSQHSRILFNKFQKRCFPDSDFILVERKQNSKTIQHF
jgi:ADP-ribose pyrophosphatase YjhB (NUDIX family)